LFFCKHHPIPTTTNGKKKRLTAARRFSSSSNTSTSTHEQQQQQSSPQTNTISNSDNDNNKKNPETVVTYVVHPQDPVDDENNSHENKSQAARLNLSIRDTTLGSTTEGAALLNGLDIYTVPALEDRHPLAVYGLHSLDISVKEKQRKPILLLHGRTWSSVPVYHLLGGEGGEHESRSLMESLYALGLQPYALDFRGFGGTPMDDTGNVEPHRCVQDTQTILQWIAQRHGTYITPAFIPSSSSIHQNHYHYHYNQSSADMPALLGWSQGALVAQLVAQSHPSLLSKLVLYGSIYDPLVRYPRDPLYAIHVGEGPDPNNTNATPRKKNTFNDAIEDFTVQGTIPHEPARLFAEAALISDPVKAQWKHTYQFNNCDPARVHTPVLVVAGDQDPYAPLHVQQDLFVNLGRGSDRTWSILSEADHAAHLLNDARKRFVNIVTSFVLNGNGI